jgi:hypothetical protein
MNNLRDWLITKGPYGITGSRVGLRSARETVAACREAEGFERRYANLLTAPNGNSKTAKNSIETYGLALAPNKTSRWVNTCTWATRGCKRHCVAHSGRGAIPQVPRARTWKTKFLAKYPWQFVELWYHELAAAAEKHNGIAHRPDMFSDLHSWEWAPDIYKIPGIVHYGYTKRPWEEWWGKTPLNLHLTWSATEHTTVPEIRRAIKQGINVAIPFDVARNKPLPESYRDIRVIDGDKSDGRYDDPPGVIVGLRAKGSLRNSGNLFAVPEDVIESESAAA